MNKTTKRRYEVARARNSVANYALLAIGGVLVGATYYLGQLVAGI